jgi:hypothetical protein
MRFREPMNPDGYPLRLALTRVLRASEEVIGPHAVPRHCLMTTRPVAI